MYEQTEYGESIDPCFKIPDKHARRYSSRLHAAIDVVSRQQPSAKGLFPRLSGMAMNRMLFEWNLHAQNVL